MDTLSGEGVEQYTDKLTTIGLQECPFQSPADQWLADPKQWPEILYYDVYHYLINFPGKNLPVASLLSLS